MYTHDSWATNGNLYNNQFNITEMRKLFISTCLFILVPIAYISMLFPRAVVTIASFLAGLDQALSGTSTQLKYVMYGITTAEENLQLLGK